MGWALLLPVGTRPEAVVSCIYAFARRVEPPALLHLFPSPGTRHEAARVAEAARALLGGVEVLETVVEEASLLGIVEAARGAIRAARGRGMRVAVDVTTGRKVMSVALYKAAVEEGADLVLYLHLKCREFEGLLYPLIPASCVELVALKGELP